MRVKRIVRPSGDAVNPAANLAEVAGHSRGLASREVEILKACVALEPIDVVGALVEQPEIEPHDSVDNLDRLAAGSRQAPQGRHDRKRQVVDTAAIHRFEGPRALIRRDLYRISAGRRHFPCSIITGSHGSEVNRRAVSRERGTDVDRRMRSETARLAARSGNHIEIELAFRIRGERNELTVRRPISAICVLSSHGRESERRWSRPDRTTQISASPERVEVKATRRPSGENSQWYSAFVDAIAMTGGRRRRRAGSGRLDTPEVVVHEATHIDQAGGFPGCAREIAGINPSSPT